MLIGRRNHRKELKVSIVSCSGLALLASMASFLSFYGKQFGRFGFWCFPFAKLVSWLLSFVTYGNCGAINFLQCRAKCAYFHAQQVSQRDVLP
jgi:hypothetical protein